MVFTPFSDFKPFMMSLYTDSEAAQVGITIMFTLIVITNLLGNTAVCLVVTLNRDMRYVMSCEITLYVCTYGVVLMYNIGQDIRLLRKKNQR